MSLAISNIAWPAELEPQVADLLALQRIRAVEVAPTKVHPEPLSAAAVDLKKYRDFWAQRGIRIVALQALLFGKPEFQLFGDAAARQEMLLYLQRLLPFAQALGAEVLVFGSPKNRVMGQLNPSEAWEIAVDFFRQIGTVAADHGCWFCIEPNPKEYGCDFVTTAKDGLRLVQDVDQPGFGLHLDAAGMTMSHDPIIASCQEAADWWWHFHVSEPNLAPIGHDAEAGTPHVELAAALRTVGYTRHISIEMKPLPAEACLSGIRKVLEFCRAVYSSTGC